MCNILATMNVVEGYNNKAGVSRRGAEKLGGTVLSWYDVSHPNVRDSLMAFRIKHISLWYLKRERKKPSAWGWSAVVSIKNEMVKHITFASNFLSIHYNS